MTNQWNQWLRDNDTDRFLLSRKQGWDAFVNAAPRTPFDTLPRDEMCQLNEDEREDYNQARFVWNANLPTVKTQQLTAAFGVLDQVMASSHRDGDRLRGSVVIDALPGLGKTTIATRFARQFHRAQYRRFGPTTSAGNQRLPVAFVSLTAGMTLKGLNQQILRFYGHPAADRVSTSRLGALAVDCVTSCHTRLVIVDDMHFIDFRHRNGVEVSNHLKGLANEMAVTFVFVGVGLSKKKFFDEGLIGEEAVYAQTSRRVTRCSVDPFTIKTEAGLRAWTNLLEVLEQHLKLADGRPKMLTDHAKTLHKRTQGTIGSLTNVIDRLSYLAIVSGAETITPELITQVVADNAAESRARRS